LDSRTSNRRQETSFSTEFQGGSTSLKDLVLSETTALAVFEGREFSAGMPDLGGCALTCRQQSGASPDRSAIGFGNETAAADATAPIAAVAPFRCNIFKSADEQAAEERNRKIRENRREKQKQRNL
jgi:hypothetical protein